MNNLYKKLIVAHNKMLQLHIDTKTKDSWVHEATELFYEGLFDVAHKIGERHVDLWGKIESKSLETMEGEIQQIIVDAKNDIEVYNKENNLSIWTQNLLGTLVNDLENMQGNSKAL